MGQGGSRSALNEINARIRVCVCVQIAGIIAGGAEQRKLELWMSSALLGASHFTLSENERQQAIARVQGVVRGVSLQLAICNCTGGNLFRWRVR